MSEVQIEDDGSWTPFSFSDPRCPYCGGEMMITESEVMDVTGNTEAGWVAAYCVDHPDGHLDAVLKFRRVKGED